MERRRPAVGNGVMERRSSKFNMLVKSIGVAFVIYTFAFVWNFELTNAPVRNDRGWLGPVIRGGHRVEDIGKVNYHAGENLWRYQIFWPLCRLWLLLNGWR